VTQQLALSMHLPPAMQGLWPPGQSQVPPTPEQISPVNAHSVESQQVLLEMQMVPHFLNSVSHCQSQVSVPLQIGVELAGPAGQGLHKVPHEPTSVSLRH
jgi:hypothetical protein